MLWALHESSQTLLLQRSPRYRRSGTLALSFCGRLRVSQCLAWASSPQCAEEPGNPVYLADMARSPLRKLLVGCAGSLVLIQLIPFGREHHNPPTRIEPAWDSPATRALAKRACFDCHSNETVWPWYASIAPISWVVTNDVMGGRYQLNFSEWNRPQEDADEAAKAVREGWMPPGMYLPAHADADLSAAESERLAQGFERSFPASQPTDRKPSP